MVATKHDDYQNLVGNMEEANAGNGMLVALASNFCRGLARTTSRQMIVEMAYGAENSLKKWLKSKSKVLLALSLYYSGLECVLSKLLSPKGAVILMYHSVGSADFIPKEANFTIKPKRFEAQIKYLTKRLKVISLAELLDKLQAGDGFSQRYAVVTFDDGYRDNLTVAGPILKRYGVPATVFLTTQCLDRGDWLDLNKLYFYLSRTELKEISFRPPQTNAGGYVTLPLRNKHEREKALLKIRSLLKSLPDKERKALLADVMKLLRDGIGPLDGSLDMLTWEEVKAMQGQGISLGSHGRSHAILSRLPIDEVRRELRDSKGQLEVMVGQQVGLFAYPNGHQEDFNDSTIKILKEEGYRCACTAIPGAVNGASDLFQLKRLGAAKPTYLLALDLLTLRP